MRRKVIFPRRRKEYRKERGPIPYVVSLELTFLPEDLDIGGYEDEVRRIVRQFMPEIMKERVMKFSPVWNGNHILFEEYDDRVSKIVEEEVARN